MKITMLLAAILASANAMASFMYVNLNGNDGYDGKTPVWDGTHGPKKTIQSAINAANPGDTVSVAPGVYGDEQGSTDMTTAGHTCRVWIDRAITLKSEVKGGAVITGRFANDPQGAVTAIRVSSEVATGAADPVEITGFTICNCANDGTVIGGVIGWNGTTKPTLSDNKGPWVVDCTISNCNLTCSGAFGYVNAARVHLRNITGSSAGVYAAHCNLIHSVFVGANGQVGFLIGSGMAMINCTVAGGSHNVFSSSNASDLYNVLVTGGANTKTYANSAHNCILLGNDLVGIWDDSVSGSTYKSQQIASSLCADYRPLCQVAGLTPNATACDFGKADWLELIPEKYRYFDFEGKAFVPENGKVHAGALQTEVTPVCGFYTTSDELTVNGIAPIAAFEPSVMSYTYVGEENWPRTYELSATLAEGKHLYGFTSDDSEVVRFPNRDGKVLFVPERGRTTKLTAQAATKVRYVDDSAGSDSGRDGEMPTTAYKTIQKGIDDMTTSDYGLVYVAPGVYDEGEQEWSSGVTPLLRVKIPSSRKIRLVASSTDEPTVIMGAADSESASRDAQGNGPKAVRCIRVNSNVHCCFQGFVITGGHTDSSSVSSASYKSGGAFMCESGKTAWLMDCVVTNNRAAVGGAAMYGGKAARCLFRDDIANSGAFFTYASGGVFCYLSGCLIQADAATATSSTLIGNDVTLVNCSIWSPVKVGKVVTSLAHGFFFNSIFANNDSMGANAGSKCIAGNVMDNTVYQSGNPMNVPPLAFTNGPSYYADPVAGDFHPATLSAAIGAGSAWGGLEDETRWTENEAYQNYYALLQHDFDGYGPNFVRGKPTAGAYQRPTRHVMVVSANRPENIESPLLGTNMVAFGEVVTVNATGINGRIITGMEVNGEHIAGSSCTFTVGGPDDCRIVDVRIFANTNWYVDAVSGSDGNHGWSEEDAFHTLTGAIAKAEFGDTVIALPGTYREGAMVQGSTFAGGETPLLPSRVVIPGGVTLTSRDGAERTVIEGVTPSGTFGDSAIRCVYLLPGATLRRFTVTGGSTRNYVSTGSGDNYTAGGIFCAETASTSVEPTLWVCDCIISNNCSRTGAAGADNGGGFVRCRFFDNRSQAGCGACSLAGRLYECIFDRNRGSSACNRPCRTYGCTFGADNRNWAGNLAPAMANDPSSSVALWPVWNSLFLGGAKCSIRCARNCIVPSADFVTSAYGTYEREVTVAEVVVDERYVPTYDSAVANAAKESYIRPIELEGDAYGNPRRSNGGMDVGAVETDWRPRYAADLGRRVKVPFADWTVVESDSGTVCLPDGATLSVEWRIPSTSAIPSVRFTVDEGAMLTIVRAGCDPVVFGPGEGEFKLAEPQSLESLSFATVGGAVELASMRSNGGLMMIVR